MCLDILPYHSTGYKRKRESTWYGRRESHNVSVYKAVCLTKPIIVYKKLRTVYEYTDGTYDSERGPVRYYSPYRNHKWVMGKLQTAPMNLVTANGNTVDVGLHAFVRRTDAVEAWMSGQVFPVVIPAGAHVYFGEHGEIVSNQMIAFASNDAIIKRYGAIGKKVRRKDIVQTLPKLIKDY